MKKTAMEKKQVILCVGIIFSLNILCVLPTVFINASGNKALANIVFMVTGFIFMWFPTISTLITRKVTMDSYKVGVRPQFKRNLGSYLQACLLPGLLTCVGAIVFFILFPQTFDLTREYAHSILGEGIAPPFELTVPIVLLFAAALTVLAPLVLINHFFAFGEEYGWRGYILPKLQLIMPSKKAILLSGALWGIGHAPLVCFGLNYGLDYPGFPYTGILMMTVFATVIGVWFSYLTMQTKSVIAASIAHGAINTVREIPLFVSVLGVNTLLGPKPSGIIGMIGFIAIAFICFFVKLNKKEL